MRTCTGCDNVGQIQKFWERQCWTSSISRPDIAAGRFSTTSDVIFDVTAQPMASNAACKAASWKA